MELFRIILWLLPVLAICVVRAEESTEDQFIKVDWSKTMIVSRSTPSLQVVVNPQLIRGAKLHDGSFRALKELGADYVRYVPWLPYPRQAVPELEPPRDGKTSWDFSTSIPHLTIS